MNTYEILIHLKGAIYVIADSAPEAYDKAIDLGFTPDDIERVAGLGTAGQNFAVTQRQGGLF